MASLGRVFYMAGDGFAGQARTGRRRKLEPEGLFHHVIHHQQIGVAVAVTQRMVGGDRAGAYYFFSLCR